MVGRQGVGVMSANGPGARSGSNTVNVASYVNELAAQERSREFKDPVSAFTKFSGHASCKLEMLSAKVESAKDAIGKATERKSAGELDDATYYAETVAARVLICLHGSLTSIYKRAKENRDIFAVRRVGVVADKLAAVSDELLMPFHYPQDLSLRKTLAEQNVKMARDAHADAIQSLQDVHTTLGVAVAEFPEPVSL